MKRILHPSDFSPASRLAFTKALDMAKANGATLHLLHVMAPVAPMFGDGYLSPGTYDQIAASGSRWAKQEMERLVKKAKAAGVKTTSTIVDGVAPAERIVKAARAARADLVVMGTHGRTGVSRFLVGSVAARVVATSPCPVLTVRGR
jgi:nucleotide-binding universal stress UspA family protein